MKKDKNYYEKFLIKRNNFLGYKNITYYQLYT